MELFRKVLNERGNWSLCNHAVEKKQLVVACRTLLSMEFSRQEYWSKLPFSPQGDLLDSGIKPMSPAFAGGFFTTETPGKRYNFSLLMISVLQWAAFVIFNFFFFFTGVLMFYFHFWFKLLFFHLEKKGKSRIRYSLSSNSAFCLLEYWHFLL